MPLLAGRASGDGEGALNAGGQEDHDARRAAQEAEEGSALSARRSPGGPALWSDTESENGLRDYLAAASRTAHDSDEALLRTPTRRAESNWSDRSGTPVARAPAGTRIYFVSGKFNIKPTKIS